MALLSVKNLTLRFSDPPLLDSVSFDINEGERVCLMGRNGEGKSTLLKIIAGEMEANSGEIIRKGYIKAPVVNASLDNFTVTVIGEQNTVIFPIEGKSLNLLQAIARFGGTRGENFNIKDVTVIRTENGVRRAYAVNLQKKDLFDSPVFYLQQNDIIYLKHKGSQMNSNVRSFFSAIGIISSFASLILSYLALTK